MEDTTQSTQTEPVVTSPHSSPAPILPKPVYKSPILILGIGLIILILLGAGGYYLFIKNSKAVVQDTTTRTTPTLQPSPALDESIYASGETYTSKNFGLSFTLSVDMKIKEYPASNDSPTHITVTSAKNPDIGYMTITMSEDEFSKIDPNGPGPKIKLDKSAYKLDKINAESYEYYCTEAGCQGRNIYFKYNNKFYDISFNLMFADSKFQESILSSFKLTDTAVDTSEWKSYTNNQYGFTFKYPEFFVPSQQKASNALAAFEGKDNVISVHVNKSAFKDYKFTDLSGVTYQYDLSTKKWMNKTNPDQIVTQIGKLPSQVEAYEIGNADGGCAGLILIIPSPDHSFVVELPTNYCARLNESTGKFEESLYQLQTSQLMSTFKFTN